MTSILLSTILVFQPLPPVAPGHAPGSEGVRLGSAAVQHPLTATGSAPDYWKDYQPWNTRVRHAGISATTSWSIDDPLMALWPMAAATNSSASSVTSDPAQPPPVLSLRERALNRFADLGAPPWVIGVFDCIGWHESGWTNKRSATADSGVLQINDIHLPQLRAEGLDPWIPEDAATYAWQLSRQGTYFTPWTVHQACGV